MEKYMIIQIVKPLAYNITDDGGGYIYVNCYEVADKDYMSLDSALTAKSKYSDPKHYIVVKYWE